MASTFGRTLAGALLAGAVLTSAAAGAQANRAWSDPPADLNAGPLTEDPASRPGSRRGTEAWPDEAARRIRPMSVAQPGSAPGRDAPGTRAADARKVPDVKETGSTRAAESRDDTPGAEQAAAAAKAERAEARAEARARESARREAARQRKVREAREVLARREAAAAVAAQRRRALAARKDASDRIRTAQPAEYEVMRLRTLVYPDGRVVEVLSRPDQDLTDFPGR